MPKKAVILSGGLGTRLKPFTDAIPKPLLPIGEKAVLEIQIERLAAHGFTEIILAPTRDMTISWIRDNLHIYRTDTYVL